MIASLGAADISDMRKAGEVAAQALKDIGEYLKPGLSTKDVEEYFDTILLKHPAMRPAFKGYSGFPSSVCVSINDEVIHGIPSARKKISDGDLVSVDLGIEYNGLFVDTAYTYMVGNVSNAAKRLCEVTKEALSEGIKEANIGNTIGDISFVIQDFVERHGFSVVRQFVGHGIGRELHMPPEIPNFGNSGSGCVIESGMALAIEPMVNAGKYEVNVMRDGWTVRTKDGSLSAHYEHTIIVTNNGPLIITE